MIKLADDGLADRLPENLYVPKSLGNPPILTIIAMAKRIGKICQS